MTEPRNPTATDSQEADSALLTFLFADIRGYTRFTQEQGDEAGARLAAKFASVARQEIESNGGRVVELRGDEAMAVFASARRALRAAVALQARCAAEMRAEPSLPLEVGIGIDAGEAVRVEGGFRGAALNLAARLCSLAGAGEILTSEGLVHLARKVPGLTYEDRGGTQLKGFADPVRVIQVTPAVPAPPSDGLETPSSPPSSPPPLPFGGFLGALPEGLLVAREEELGQILATLDIVAEGSGRFLLLSGEPGVGKTRLAQEAMVIALNRKFLIATGRCYEPERAVPFYPFLDALAAVYDAAPRALRAEIGRRWPQLGRLLPDRIALPGAPSSDGEEEQQRLFRAVTSFLQAVSETAPIAMLLDDLHWVDDSSLKLLQHLVRHTRSHRVLLLGTFRDVDVDKHQGLERFLLDLYRERLVVQTGVRRLNQDETAALVAAQMGTASIPEHFVELVHHHTDGNPFFVQEVLRTLVERGDIRRDGDRWSSRAPEEIEVPQTVRLVIGQRLARLNRPAQEILQEASVLGQTFAFDDLQMMSPEHRSEEEIEEALQEAVGAGLVREAGHDLFTFNHVLTQQALYTELPTRRRRRLHLAAGETLEQSPGRQAAQLAWHFMEGNDGRRALPAAILAGDEAEAMFAHAEAERHYRTALDLAVSLNDASRVRECLEKLGAVLRTQGRYDDALAVLERAAGMFAAAGDLEGEGRVTALIGYVHHVRGTLQEGIQRIESVLARLEREADHSSVAYTGIQLYVPLAHLYFLNASYQDSLAAAERAEELAATLGDDPVAVRLRAEVAALHGTTLWPLGRGQEALPLLEEAIARAEAVEDSETLFLALDCIAEIHLVGGELQRSKRYTEWAIDLMDRLGDVAKLAFELAALGNVTFWLGAWKEARRHFRRATELVRSLDTSWVTAYVAIRQSICDLAEGNWEIASRDLTEGIALAERTNSAWARAHGHGLLAELEILEGRPEAARARLEPLVDQPDLANLELLTLQSLLAWAHLETGEEDRAEELLRRTLDTAAARHNRLDLLDAQRLYGMVLTRQGRWSEAEHTFQAALDLSRNMSVPYAEARALEAYAALQARTERRDRARALLQEARSIFRRLGARKDVERIEREVDLSRL